MGRAKILVSPSSRTHMSTRSKRALYKEIRNGALLCFNDSKRRRTKFQNLTIRQGKQIHVPFPWFSVFLRCCNQLPTEELFRKYHHNNINNNKRFCRPPLLSTARRRRRRPSAPQTTTTIGGKTLDIVDITQR